MPKRFAAWLLCLSLLLSLPSLADAPYMGGGHTYIRSHTYTPAENTRYTVNTLRHTSAGIEEEHILSFSPNSGLQPVLVTSDSLYGGGITLEEATQKLRMRGLDVVGGVNGSFFNSDMSPVGLQVRDGVLTSMGGAWQPAVGFTNDGAAVFGSPGYGITITGAGGTVTVDRLNQSRQSDQVFLYTNDFSSNTRTKLDGLHVVIQADGKLVPGNTLYGKVTRVLPGTDPALIGEGEFVLSANTNSAIDRFRFLREGDDVLLSVTCSDARWVGVSAAVGGIEILMKDGQIQPVTGTSRAPRTAAGITAEGEILFFTVDGRQSGYSAGLTLPELAARMAELGCVSAFNLDGGGSTVMSVRMPGETKVKVVNKPSDGSLRRCADFILFCNILPPSDGQAKHLFPNPAYVTMMPGASVDFSFLAADSAYRAAPLPAEPVSAAQINGVSGILEGSSFTSALPGDALLAFSAGNAYGTAQVHITPKLDSMNVTDLATGHSVSEITAVPGQSVWLTASGTLNGKPVISSARSFLWATEGNIGSVSPDGEFIASSDLGAKGNILVSGGGLTTLISVCVGGDPVIVEDFENGLGSLSPIGEGINASVTHDANIIERGTSAAAVSYKFHEVWFTALSVSLNAELKNSPKTFAILVTGDGSGHKILAEVATTDGQMILVPLGALDFTGPKYISAELPANAQSIKKLVMHPNLDGSPTGMFYLHEIVSLWMDALPDAHPLIHIDTPFTEEKELVYNLQVTDFTGTLPEEVIVYWDGEAVTDILWDSLTGKSEIRVPLPSEGLHTLSIITSDILGRRTRTFSADEYGHTYKEGNFFDTTDKWFTGYVNFLDDKNILDSDLVFGLRYFHPEREVTRLEVMVMIARILEIDLSSYAHIDLPFADTENLSEYEVSVVKAIFAEKIISGKLVNGELCITPYSNMSHAEIFTILYNTLPQGYKRSDLSYFADAQSVPAFALRATQTLVDMKVVRGSGGNLGFRSSMSRAEIASLFCRFFY